MEGNKNFKRPIVPTPPLRKLDRSWARSTSEISILLSEHLASVSTPNCDNNIDDDIAAYINASCQLSLPVRAFIPTEIKNAITLLNPHKAPGQDLIIATPLKNVQRKAIPHITYIYNSILLLCQFPIQWKLAQIFMISNPGKTPTNDIV
jgi:hypothetical protein